MNKHIWTDKSLRSTPASDKRNAERRDINVPARLTWKDQRGVQRFAASEESLLAISRQNMV